MYRAEPSEILYKCALLVSHKIYVIGIPFWLFKEIHELRFNCCERLGTSVDIMNFLAL
jgi:hypothetical protein